MFRPFLLAPLAVPVLLIGVLISVAYVAAFGSDDRLTAAVLAIGLPPTLVILLPLAYVTSAAAALLAFAARVDVRTLSLSRVLLGVCGVMVGLGYALRWWTGNGAPGWMPLLLVPLALAQGLAFLWLRRGRTPNGSSDRREEHGNRRDARQPSRTRRTA